MIKEALKLPISPTYVLADSWFICSKFITELTQQNLGLNKCQSIDFNTHIASVTINFINYGLLSIQRRINKYETIGGIFRHLQNEIFETNLINRNREMFNKILNNFFFEIVADWEVIMEKCMSQQKQLTIMITEVANLFRPKPLT